MNFEGKTQLKFSRKGSEVKAYLKRAHDDTYCNLLARTLNIKCYGAFIGTYPEDEHELKKRLKFPLISIPRGDYPVTDDFTRTIKFYTNFF